MKPLHPAHYWIVVLDIENFSTRPDPVQVQLRETMHRLVQNAIHDAHLDQDPPGIKDEGDGLILFFATQVPPVRIAGDLVARLDDGLAEIRTIFRPEHQIRMRLSLHHGMATADPTGWPGDATNVACRLVDVDLLRRVLAAVGSANLVVIASDDFFRTVVRPGYRTVAPETYHPVVVDLKKAPGTPAWIHIPGHSYPALPIPQATVEDLALSIAARPELPPAPDVVRKSLLAELRYLATETKDDGLAYVLDMIEADLGQADPGRTSLSRSLARLCRLRPEVREDPRLRTGFGEISDLP